jgi:uncharacterized protein DUF6893
MKNITIGPRGQVLSLLVLVALVAGAVLAQLPEIQRYLKVRSM